MTVFPTFFIRKKSVTPDHRAMKVLFISRLIPPYYNGAGQAAFQMVKYLKARGIAVTVLTSRYDSNLPAFDVIEGMPVYRFMANPNYRLTRPLFHLQCAYWLLRHPTVCDVIQFANMPSYWLPVQVVARLLRTRVFIWMTLFGSDDFTTLSRFLKGRLRIASYQRVHGILAMTSKLIDSSTKYLRDPSTIRYFPYPVDTAVFYPQADAAEKVALRKKIGEGSEEKIAVFVGSVMKRKGIDLLVEAWPSVIKTLPQARLYIVGPRTFNSEYRFNNGDFTMSIDKRIEELGIGESLVFTGDMKQGVSDYFRMADLFILPSRQEGLANAVLEAMACGLPCIVCKQPWLPDDLVRHGETGLVCESTPESIADGILTILTNRDLAERMGAAARKVAERDYNPVNLTNKLIEIYASSLQ